MALEKMYAVWRNLMDNKSDERTSGWFLMSSPFPTLAICMSYFYIVKVLGPKLMENRKPFKIREILVVYNLFQTICNLYIFWMAGKVGWFGRYNWQCQLIDRSRDELAMKMVKISYLFYMSRFADFFDTFFFIMRKRYDQISTLHVIHHGYLPFLFWWLVKFMPGGHHTFAGFINCFVHIVMYLYYMLAAMGPKVQKFLWWKKYLTILQIIQFIIVIVHSLQLLFYNPCNFPMTFTYIAFAHALFFLILFAYFYRDAYSGKRDRIKAK